MCAVLVSGRVSNLAGTLAPMSNEPTILGRSQFGGRAARDVDDTTWNRVVEQAHAYHWARRGPADSPPVDRDGNAQRLVTLASGRAATVGKSVAQVLSEAGFHPVTGMSMRPAPDHPQWETRPRNRLVPVGGQKLS